MRGACQGYFSSSRERLVMPSDDNNVYSVSLRVEQHVNKQHVTNRTVVFVASHAGDISTA